MSSIDIEVRSRFKNGDLRAATPTESVVIGYDPGLLSGIAAVAYREDSAEVLFSSEEPWDASITTILALADVYPQAYIVVEKYTITIATARKTQAPWSLWCIGAVGWGLGLSERDIILQTPVDAKRFTDNARLRALGLWHRGGKGHANDALRHTVLGAVRKGWIPPVV